MEDGSNKKRRMMSPDELLISTNASLILKHINQPVLFFSKLLPVSCNNAFYTLFEVERPSFPSFFPHGFSNDFNQSDYDTFLDCLSMCYKTCKPLESNFLLSTSKSSNRFMTSVRFIPIDNDNACCIFTPQRLSFFEIADVHGDPSWNIVEYWEEEDDFRIIMCSETNAQFLEKTGTSKDRIIGYFMGKDHKLTQSMSWWTERFQNLKKGPVHSDIIERLEETPCGRRVLQLKIHYLPNIQGTSIVQNGVIKKKRVLYLVAVSDITEIRDMENQIAQEKTNLEKMAVLQCFFDRSPLIMGTVLANETFDDFEFVLLNNNGSNFVSAPGTTLSGKLGSQVFSPEYLQNWLLKMKECLLADDRTTQIELETPSGTFLTTIHFLGNNTFSYLSQDITARKRLEEQLEQNQEKLENLVTSRTNQLKNALDAKSKFLAIMSHEIRTPLSGIMGALSVLTDSVLDAEQSEMINVANVCAEQLLVVINDILDISKMEENKMVLENTVFSLENTLEEALEVVSVHAAQKLELIYDDTTPIIYDKYIGDHLRLRQIIVNLLSNAIKFSDHGDVILRAVTRPLPTDYSKDGQDYMEIEISVQDFGVGIAFEVQEKLLKPFTQADSSITRKYGGSGLGLSISKRLVELMDGTLTFTSVPGKGSTFQFTVRLPISPDGKLEPWIIDVNDKTLNGKHVLIVDFNDNSSRIMKHRLWNRWKIHSECANSLATVQKCLLDQNWDLAIVDSNQSIEVVNLLEKSTRVAIMGYNRSLLVQQRHPPITFLKKPVRSKMLYVTLQECLQRKAPIVNNKSQNGKFPAHTSRILIAEDNTINQRIITKLLKSIGFNEVTIVGNGKAAVERVEKEDFDLILMDVMMPEMDGIEATSIIRSRATQTDKNHPIIVAFTADAFEENKQKCLAAGMNYVLTKPVGKDHLNEVLKLFFQI